mmetsp:Transcript_14604/g.24821  ORF Transcript_14604/g.24821 Transcript_14604/m.24821 type:complete len:449 (-) Transcript_14604:1062-2408(-)
MNTTRNFLLAFSVVSATAFVADNSVYHSPILSCRTTTETCLRMSSVGGEDNRDGNDSNDDNPLNEWMSRKETENLRRAREQIAEGRLPISYGAMNMDDNSDANKAENESTDSSGMGQFGPLSTENNNNKAGDAIDVPSSSSSSSLARGKQNPYLNVVSRLSPSDLIARFTATASPRVQDAVRTTILGLIGGLPTMAFETKTVATGERLASLMFQLQMTGYMFANAEYRASLSQSLGSSNTLMLNGESSQDGKAWLDGKRIDGKIKVRYGASAGANSESSIDDESESPSPSTFGMEVEVDAEAYMAELRGEVSRLREELDATKQAKEEEIRKDLLAYIRTLPKQELSQLTGTMSPEVLEAMKGLVTAVLAGIGGNELEELAGLDDGSKIGPNTVTEQSGEALAQLCMWQLVVGFNLRELEVREEFRASMKMIGSTSNNAEEAGGSSDFE